MMCSFCGESKDKVACSEQGDRLVAICESCITWAEEQVSSRGPSPLEVMFPDLHKDPASSGASSTALQSVDPSIMESIFQDHPPDAICLDCGRRFDDESQCHEIWKDDGCHFTLNTEENRLARVRREVQLLIDRGMMPDDIILAVKQTVIFIHGGIE